MISAARRSCWRPTGNPLVFGRLDVDGNAPTVTLYNHLDVQPASRETEPWNTDPFVFTQEGDRYFGRGTTDDKGPALSALWGAKAAREAGVRANIHFLWEAEEEIGSGSFETAIKAHADELEDRFHRSSATRSGSRATDRPARRGCAACRDSSLSLRDRDDRPALRRHRRRARAIPSAS